MVTVQSLHLHPVKACRGIEVERMVLGPTGPVGDRRWQIVDADGERVTQRTVPALATVEAVPIDGGLRLTAPGRTPVEVADPADGSAGTGSGGTGSGGRDSEGTAATLTVRTRREEPAVAADGGDEVAAWLTELIGAPSRLAGILPVTDIRLPEPIDLWGHRLAFVDAAPILVANLASAAWLAERATEPFGIDRFRANVVVDGAEPWAEDRWHEFTIGAARFRAEVPWPRCAVPQVDQVTGERHREPALVLRAHRWCAEAPTAAEPLRPFVEGQTLFGIACDAGPVGAEVAVGDEVEVLGTRPPILAPPA